MTSTQSAAPGPLAPAPMCARLFPRTTAAAPLPPAMRPTCTIEASTPYDGYLSSRRGAINSSPDSLACSCVNCSTRGVVQLDRHHHSGEHDRFT